MKTKTEPNRRGTVLVLTAALIVFLLGLLALSVDVGYLFVVRSELQRTADAGAVSAAWELIDESVLTGDGDPYVAIAAAEAKAAEYAAMNPVAKQSPGLGVDDTLVGYPATPSDPNAQMTFDDPTRFNAVWVRAQRTATQNGEVPLFFAKVLGFDTQPLVAEATACFISNFGGFEAPSDGSNLDILPFALDLETWDGLLGGVGNDDWTWNEQLEQVEAGPDGILGVNLFPQGTGSPGNRGTVDIGSSNTSTADIARQILYGISQEDLAHHGGKLEFDENGELFLNGDTGISAGFKDELASIKGEPRIIPIFSEVTGPGNNAMYTIVRFVGIRIMEVKLTGPMSRKRVMVQPAKVITKGGIPATGPPKSYFIYSPVWIVR
ncbi:MAG TPA: hypothetical protein EYH34_15620 [Planctomycetes bacterium]|nr:hypothetical protein [Planctomycetota bacterium]